jgi:hypothetical protein
MAKITVETDGTIANTKLSVDGKEVTKKENVVGIYLTAGASYRSKYSGDLYKGHVSVEYVTVDDKGVAERKAYGTTDTNYTNGLGQKLKSQDQVEDSIVRFVGQDADNEVASIVDKIIAHCEEKGIVCPNKDTLLSRNLQSLQDKAADLEIKLED